MTHYVFRSPTEGQFIGLAKCAEKRDAVNLAGLIPGQVFFVDEDELDHPDCSNFHIDWRDYEERMKRIDQGIGAIR